MVPRRRTLSVALLALVSMADRATNACPTDEPRATPRFNVDSDRLYLEGEGCITPSQIYEAKLANDSSIPIKAVEEDGQNSVNETGYV